MEGVPAFLHWWDLPWPLSQIAFEWSRGALLALAALPVLAVGLMISRNVSLGQPVSDCGDQPGADHAWPFSTRLSRYLSVVKGSCAWQSLSLEDPNPAAALRRAIVLFQLPRLGVARLHIASTHYPNCRARRHRVVNGAAQGVVPPCPCEVESAARRTASSTPFTKCTDSSPEYRRANSSASSITTGAGVSVFFIS